MSGSFAELRANHFHSGIDIKSRRGTIGDTLRAASEGYVSRIKLEYGGYGRALYIDHPSGHTTVYAHMHKFTNDINKYIYEMQQKSDSYALDLYLPDSLFSFEKGEYIGLMGNSGRSYGPHLHFEIRNTVSEKPINPYLMGIGPNDSKAPVLQSVMLHHLDNDFNIIKRTKLDKKLKNKNVAAWRIGIAIAAFDKMDAANNKNGVYRIDLKVDDILYFQYQADSFSFDETRQINAAIDYPYYKSVGNRFINCYKLPAEDLTMVKNANGEYNAGLIKLFKDRSRKIELELTDYFGNTKSYTWKIKRDQNMVEVTPESFNQYLKYDTLNIIQHNNFSASFPPGSLYRNLKANYSYASDLNETSVSLLNNSIPLRKAIDLSIKIPSSASDKSKLCLYHKASNTSYGAVINNNYASAKVDRLGDFVLLKEDIAPTIKFISRKNNVLRFSLSDNVKTRGNAQDLQYHCKLNGKWILGEYSLKTKRISIDLKGQNAKNGDLLEIWAIDDRSNKCHHKHIL